MIVLNKKNPLLDYEDRHTVYGIIQNDKKEFALVEMLDWGFNFLGGKIEENENPEEALKRETFEEIGYSLKSITYVNTYEVYYEVFVRNQNIPTHSITEIYFGLIDVKKGDSKERTKLHWFSKKEVCGKLKLPYLNDIFSIIFKV